MHVIGVDVGGTKIAAAALDTKTEDLHGATTISTSNQGADAVLDQIADLVRAVAQKASLKWEDVAGVGVGFPATFDYERGQTLLIPNIIGEWWGKPVVQILRDKLEKPVAIINDARAFTLAEATHGAGRGAPSVACFTLGTGIGGGFAINGKLHLGLSGSAGEFGHHTINFNGLPDGSGTPGGMEGYASGPAVTAMAVKAVLQGIDTEIADLVEHDIRQITPKIIQQAAEQGDTVAQDILQQAGFYIGVGISNILMILAPHKVVIGGGMAEMGNWILDPIRETVRRYCFTLPLDQLTIATAALGSQAGVIGAALWAAAQQVPD